MNKPLGIFLIGGPGSGKDYVLKNIFSRFDLTEVQIDQLLSGSASELVESKQNIVINGAIDEEKIKVVKSLLEHYEFDYVFVSVSNKVSRERNAVRGQPLSENKRIEKFLRAEKLAESVKAFDFNNSINLNESKEMERIFFGNQIEKLLERLIEFGLVIQEEATPKAFTLLREKKFPPVAKDKESGLPKKYVRGLSASTAKARKAHWKKMSKYSDRDSRAYEPAPGDATAKTKPSKHTIAVRKMMDEAEQQKVRRIARSGNITAVMDKRKETGRVDEGAADNSIAAKAKRSGISVGTLRKVYNRGVAAWNSGHRPGTTPQQWGHARVNSYINKGKTYHTADKDLREDVNIDELFEMQLMGTDEYRKHAVAITPGQTKNFKQFVKIKNESEAVDVTPSLSVKKPKKKMTPGSLRNSDLDGLPVVSAYAMHEEMTLQEAVEYHVKNEISIVENVFRPGSNMFFQMIDEAKKLYQEGKYTPVDEYEDELLNSNIGEVVEFEGKLVVLDYPVEEGLEEACWSGYTQKGMKKTGNKMVPNCVPVNEEDKTEGKGIGKPWREGGGGAVYVRDGGSIRKVRFSQSGMAKKYMDPGATRSFVARHHCLTNKDKTSASYWACRWPRFFSNSGKTWW